MPEAEADGGQKEEAEEAPAAREPSIIVTFTAEEASVATFEAEPAASSEEPPEPIERHTFAALPAPPQAFAMAQPPEPIAPDPSVGQRWRMQLCFGLAGLALCTLFFLPWQGATSLELLPYLGALDYARQLSLLVGGAALLSAALLPVPVAFRAACGLLIGTTGLCLGGYMLTRWQGLLSALTLVLLPASLLVRTTRPRARLPRVLGLMAVLALLALYLAPRQGVMPIRVVADLLSAGREDRFIATYLLLPLPLVGLAIVALLGADVAALGEVLAWLLLFWGPGAILVLLIDQTQAYMALSLLSYSACASYGAAELLSRIGRTEPTAP